MERYVFFNTNSAEVLHCRDYQGSSDIMKLAFESYSLLQITDFTLKSICREKLYCFAKDLHHPLAVALEFSEGSTTEEDGYLFAVSMMQLFMQQFGHILTGKFNTNSFKTYRKSLLMIIDQYLEPIMEKIADDSKAVFLYLAFLKRNREKPGTEKSLFLSPSSSVNTDISSIEKAANSNLKKKYPFVMEKEALISSPRQLFYRLYSKESAITPQIVSLLNIIANQANEMLEFAKDDLQVMNFCFGQSEIHAVKYEEMLLVISSPVCAHITTQVKQLYSWARLLIV